MSGTGGWYPDPQDPSRARWWDGEWTGHVHDPDAPARGVATLTRPPEPREPREPAAPDPLSLPSLDTDPPPEGSPPAEVPTEAPHTAQSPAEAPLTPASKPRREGSSVSPIKVAIIILTVGLLLVGGLWVAGIVSPSDDGAASAGDTSFQGPGYTIDVPAEWSRQSGALATNVDAAFSAPDATLTLGSVEGDPTQLADDAARQAAFDSMLRVQLSVYPDVAVVSRAPASLDGAPGERITLEGPGPTGETVRVVELVAVRDGRIVFLGIEGMPAAVDAASPSFDATVDSFSFDG